jgi:hypothetical protein
MASAAVESWVRRLPADDPLVIANTQLRETFNKLGWPSELGIHRGTSAGLRLMLVNDYDRLSQIVETDMDSIPTGRSVVGADLLDTALCTAGIFTRSPQRGTSRRRAEPPWTVEQLVTQRIPPPFDEVTIAYLTAYQQRVSRNYSTTRTKLRSLTYFWQYIIEEHPESRPAGRSCRTTPADSFPGRWSKDAPCNAAPTARRPKTPLRPMTGSSTSTLSSPTSATGPPNPAHR